MTPTAHDLQGPRPWIATFMGAAVKQGARRGVLCHTLSYVHAGRTRRALALPPARLISHPSPAPLLPAKKVKDLESTRPSEIALETNVLRYLANCLERRCGLAEGAVTLTSPTQHEEKTLGFDAMAGLPDGRYAVLQFKRPEFHGDVIYFKLPLHQFCAMLRHPPRSAFYMLPIVFTNKAMWDIRTCLLSSVMAIDAQDLFAPFSLACPTPRPPCRNECSGRCTLKICADLKSGTAYTSVSTRVFPYLIPFTRAGSLCHDSDRIGFVIRNGTIKSRDGRRWGRREWKRIAKNASKPYNDHASTSYGRDFISAGLDTEELPPITQKQLEEWANCVWTPDRMARREEPDYGGNLHIAGFGDAPTDAGRQNRARPTAPDPDR